MIQLLGKILTVCCPEWVSIASSVHNIKTTKVILLTNTKDYVPESLDAEYASGKAWEVQLGILFSFLLYFWLFRNKTGKGHEYMVCPCIF